MAFHPITRWWWWLTGGTTTPGTGYCVEQQSEWNAVMVAGDSWNQPSDRQQEWHAVFVQGETWNEVAERQIEFLSTPEASQECH